MKTSALALCLGLSVVGTFPALSQETGFAPLAPCAQVLRDYGPPAAVWASGYLSALEGNMRDLDRDTLNNMGRELANACKTAPGTEFATLVAQLASDQPASEEALAQPVEAGEMPPGVPDIARPLVERFLATDLDLVEILRSLRPTQDEIAILYPEEMARKLDAVYEGMFGDTLDREGFPPGPVEIEFGFTSTFELEQAPFVDELPGGFRQFFEVFQVDVPFGYINVIFSQVQDNMQLSGFTYINDRWVLMPRPWRALD